MKKIITILFLYFGYIIAASACDMKQIPFGESIDTVALKYGLDTLGADPTKQSEIADRGTQFCSTLPGNSIAVFTFLYNQLVQVEIEVRDSKDVLLSFIKESYSMPEQNEDSPKNTLIFDPANPSQSIIYKTQFYEEGKEEEILSITSKRYEGLFKKAAREDKGNIVKD